MRADHREDDLVALIKRAARKFKIAPVGFAGALATGEKNDCAPLELFVLAADKKAIPFGEELARSTNRDVHIYDPRAIPFSHPLHFSVRWLHKSMIPRVHVPLGAVVKCVHGKSVSMPLDHVPHFFPSKISLSRASIRSRPLRIIQRAPIGGFLLEKN